MNRWLEIDLWVSAGFEEAVSNFVMEQGATGVEEIDEEQGRKGLKTYFPRKGRDQRVLNALQRYLKSLQRLYPGQFHYRIENLTLPDKDWGESWKKFFKPVKVTSRIVVKPPWRSIRLKRGQIPIEITPGLAFGTGTHATTQLCIRTLAKRLRVKGLSVLDVGTGSGILAIIAAKLEASEVWGVDTDDLSVEIAGENVERNNVSHIVRIRLGTVGDVRSPFDVVVANIDLRVLNRMRWPLLHRVKPGGYLILSGLLAEEENALRKRYLDTGQFQFKEIKTQGEWACLTLRKKGGEG
jgi:ribosomal protein L11 methyltransferase